ncbi:MAG TPA: transglutaminaseTgpA domain-containing protein, partial [Pseudomonadales bacterium]|nr:transglutaminaseTgpA domain-containing protein [Pseudomonadales bacterium]
MAAIHFEKHFSNQLSRHALLYLLSSFVACNALLLAFLPWWLFLVAAGCLVWRGLIFTGRASFPARILRVILVLISGAALFAQYRFSLSIDLFVTLLLLGFSLKLLELYQKQDAQLLLYLSL